jgi:hypothetical protein
MRKNPFGRKNRNNPTTGDVDASAVLGQPLADKLAATVDNTPGLSTILANTASAVQPEDVEDPTVTVVGVVVDTSWSADRYMAALGQSHDELRNSLLPALAENVTILMTCTTLDGQLIYPLTRLSDVRLFGRDTGRPDGELDYGHMKSVFRANMITSTPLRDRVKEQIMALMAELLKWENPAVARTVNVISSVLTDGLDNTSKTKADELSGLVGEIEESGSLTCVATMIAELDDEFRQVLIRNIQGIDKQGRPVPGHSNNHTLPDGYETMSTEELLRWWCFEQGLAADYDRLWLPGTDLKAIRRAAGQMSQTAFQASVGAFREDGDETVKIDDRGTVVIPLAE